MNKKLLSLLLALVMVFSFIPAFAAEEAPAETDKTVEETEKAVEEAEEVAAPEEAETTPEFVKFLTDNGYVQGDKKGDLMLDKNLTRAEFTALLARLDGKDEVAKAMKTLGSKFTDVTEAHWAKGYISFAAGKDWVKGYPNGSFQPEGNITYAEIATVLVRYLGVDTMGFSYPVDYIAKAFELGLMKDLPAIEEYKQAATRQNMFQMLYNTISQRDFGKFSQYKMIVLENNRTSNLGATEVKAEVLSVIQQANNVDERGIAKIGEQKVFNLVRKNAKGEDEVIGDSEYLLGKVINATVNADGELVKVVVDKDNYKYLFGDLTKATEKQLGVNWSNYDVRIDERYYNRENRRYDNDDRMYRTYVTTGNRSANYNYKEFAREVAANRINPNFVRATVKDGMVMFIDTFAVKDIAPVADVKRDGKDVYYYNDMRNGSVDRMTPARRVIGFTAEKEFYNMKAEDIMKDDVIHMLEGVTLVRQDAKVEGKLEKTFVDADGEWAVIGENDYWLSSVAGGADEYLRSVYAYDDNHYRTTEHRGNINAMVGGDVKALLDIAGNIQLITSDKSFKDTIGMVKKWNSNYPVFAAANAEKDYNLDVVRDTDIVTNKWNDTGVQREAEFREFDILYTIGGEDAKAELLAGFIRRNDYAEGMKPASFERTYYRYLTVGDKTYRYDDDTKVFVVNDIKATQQGYDFSDASIIPATMADVAKYNEKNDTLRAYVINEKQFRTFIEKGLNINRYNLYGDREDLAKVVVFTNYVGPKADLTAPEYARIAKVDNYANSVTLEVNRGEFVDYIVDTNADKAFLRNAKIGQVVKFCEVKGAEKKTAVFVVKINDEYINPVVESNRGAVTSVGYIGQNGIVTINGRDYYTTRYTKVFGDVNKRYAVVYATLNDADVIVYGDAPYVAPVELTALQKNLLKQYENAVNEAVKAAADGKTEAEVAELIIKANKLYDEKIKGDKALEDAAKAKREESNNLEKAFKKAVDEFALLQYVPDFATANKELKDKNDVKVGDITYDTEKATATLTFDATFAGKPIADLQNFKGKGLINKGVTFAKSHGVTKAAIGNGEYIDIDNQSDLKNAIVNELTPAFKGKQYVADFAGTSFTARFVVEGVTEPIVITFVAAK